MDKKCFVFCIGGTGLRVMKSALMMMAAGMETSGYTIVPIIIDPHVELEEQRNLTKLIGHYKTIHNEAWRLVNPEHGFFVSSVKNLSEVVGETTTEMTSNEEHRTFGQFIGVENIPSSDINSLLVESLFSSKNIDSSLDVGFKGNPNVGTVVLGEQFAARGDIKQFKTHVNDDDRIFIVSSIFGGTGASGAPLLQKIIRSSKDNPKLQNAVLGGVTVLPYFKLGDPKRNHSDIDSSVFLTKTRAALSYYSEAIHPDYQYYIGEQSMRGTYENDEQKQKNPANFIELTAASSLFHFLRQPMPKEQGKTITLMRAIEQDAPILDIKAMGESYSDIIKSVTDGHLLTLLTSGLPDERWLPLRVTKKINTSFYKDRDFGYLSEWQSIFEQWRGELESSDRSFSPLGSDSVNLGDIVKNLTLEDLNDISCLYLQMLNTSHIKKASRQSLLGTLLSYAYSAIDCYTAKIKIS